MRTNCQVCKRKNKLNNWWYINLEEGFMFCCLECGISYMLQKGMWNKRNVEEYIEWGGSNDN